MIERLVIFGAAGDLAGRYLFPALCQLEAAGQLPPGLDVVASALDDLDTATFRDRAETLLARHAGDVAEPARRALLERTSYVPADAARREDVVEALDGSSGPVGCYLALPPAVFGPALEALGARGLAPGSRVVVEKPFGHGLEDARRLNDLVDRTVGEDAVFRVDHFLGKQTVQNVLGLRFANRVFEPVWNAQHVERVDIVWDETLGLEDRAAYYDTAGALRDMVQNHLLQLLCFVAMEPPFALDERTLRNRKVEVLRAVRSLGEEEIAARTVRGRYAAGHVGGRDVPAYADEDGVDPGRGTETFAQVALAIDNWRWAGVPFVLRSGKALGRKRQEIVVRFRPVPHLAFPPGEEATPNVLRLALSPDRMSLAVSINGPGDRLTLEEAELSAQLAPQDLSAYALLLLDVMEGDASLGIRGDEAEESWRIVEPVLAAWGAGTVPLREYAAGSSGPGGAS